MDFKKFVSDAGTKLNRVVQQAEETFLTTDKTVYDTEYLDLVKKLDLLKIWTDRFVIEASKVLEPNIANRLENKVMDKLEKSKERATPLEVYGGLYESAAESFVSINPDFSKYLSTFGSIQVRVGVTSREFQKSATEAYVSKLKIMLDEDIKKYQDEHMQLENLRLDLDSAKAKNKKQLKDAAKQTAEDNYQKAQKLFDDHLQTNRILFKSIDDLYAKHKELMKAFVDVQRKYYNECTKELDRLERQL